MRQILNLTNVNYIESEFNIPDIQAIITRCEEIVKEGNEILSLSKAAEKIPKIPKVNASIENIYNLCYPKGIPSYLALENQMETLVKQGIAPQFIDEIGLFEIRFNTFQGFIENLKKGLITTDLMSILSMDIYNDMIEQAKELRKLNTEAVNRAACVLSRIVLEDGLKKICTKHGITLTSNKANEANMELKKNSIYGNTQFKQVDTWLSIGNTAAHPQDPRLDFRSISETQMDDMIKEIPNFINKYL